MLPLEVSLAGVGLWARGLTSFAALQQAMSDDFAGLAQATFEAPKPQSITAKERRRAGLVINLAVEVAHQACAVAAVDPGQVPSVFVSAMGDTAITDYMCRKLAQPEKMLSPTKFHNSVHNAPSGYWTISAENREPSSFVGGYTESVGAGLLEAASQAQAFGRPVLAVFYDIANEAPFSQLQPISETLGVALILTPSGLSSQVDAKVKPLDCQFSYVAQQPGEVQSLPKSNALAVLAKANTIGPILALVEQFAAAQSGGLRSPSLRFAAAPDAWLEIQH